MKKCLALFALAVLFLPELSWAGKTTYIVTNHRLNYVRLKEVKGRVAEERVMSHPVSLDEGGLRSALASLHLSRSYVISKEVDTQQIFDDRALNFLAPALVKAFSQANSMEEVNFSYLSKNPLFIIRNDRLTMATAWVHDRELHVKFDKLYAPIFGDIDKRGTEDKIAAKSRGLRVKLELGEGQKYGIKDPEEIVLDLNYNYAQKQDAAASGAAADETTPQTPKERLTQLKKLKDDGFITKEEYEKKREEIIKGL